jgi:hypothetical protein
MFVRSHSLFLINWITTVFQIKWYTSYYKTLKFYFEAKYDFPLDELYYTPNGVW